MCHQVTLQRQKFRKKDRSPAQKPGYSRWLFPLLINHWESEEEYVWGAPLGECPAGSGGDSFVNAALGANPTQLFLSGLRTGGQHTVLWPLWHYNLKSKSWFLEFISWMFSVTLSFFGVNWSQHGRSCVHRETPCDLDFPNDRYCQQERIFIRKFLCVESELSISCWHDINFYMYVFGAGHYIQRKVSFHAFWVISACLCARYNALS